MNNTFIVVSNQVKQLELQVLFWVTDSRIWSLRGVKQRNTKLACCFFFLVITYMKTAHTLIFTLNSTPQGKDWNIFSSRFHLVHAYLAPATRCQSAAHFKLWFRIPHSKWRASGKETPAWFKLPPGFFLYFCFFAQAVLHTQGIDGSSHGSNSNNANPLRWPATLPGACPGGLIWGNRSSAQPSLFIPRTSTTGRRVGVNTPIINSWTSTDMDRKSCQKGDGRDF